MEDLQKKVKDALLTVFSEPEIHLERANGNKVAGFIISEKFQGKDAESRQNSIWAILKKYLND